MSELTTSIAMATFNGAMYLNEQLDSFAEQTQRPDELVVTDDGSTDATITILESFRSRAPFQVKVYRNETTLGFTKNFEKAISLCANEIIFLSDQDDVWFPSKIATVCATFKANPGVCVVINDQSITDDRLHPVGVTVLENLHSMGFGDSSYIPGCCTSMRRDALRLALPIPSDHATQSRWINCVFDLLDSRKVVATPLQYYRRHSSNATDALASRTRRMSILDLLRAHRFRDASDAWRDRIKLNTLITCRLQERAHVLVDLGLLCAAERTQEELENETEALRARIAIVAKPRWRRLPLVLRFLTEGKYNHFAGLKSALKDTVR